MSTNCSVRCRIAEQVYGLSCQLHIPITLRICRNHRQRRLIDNHGERDGWVVIGGPFLVLCGLSFDGDRKPPKRSASFRPCAHRDFLTRTTVVRVLFYVMSRCMQPGFQNRAVQPPFDSEPHTTLVMAKRTAAKPSCPRSARLRQRHARPNAIIIAAGKISIFLILDRWGAHRPAVGWQSSQTEWDRCALLC